MLLAIDIGNSGIEWKVFEGCGRPEILISSVVPAINRPVARACMKGFGIRPKFIRPKDVGIKISGYDKKQIGVDRLLAAYMAFERHRRAIIIIDAGTALTIDAVSGRGEFLGGVIVPGLGSAARFLYASTAKLPLVKITPSKKVTGHNTRQAISHGIYHGYTGLAEYIVRRMVRELKLKSPIVVATGGDARLIARHSGTIDRVEPDLVLAGLKFMWDKALGDIHATKGNRNTYRGR